MDSVKTKPATVNVADRGEVYALGPWRFDIDEAKRLLSLHPRSTENLGVESWFKATHIFSMAHHHANYIATINLDTAEPVIMAALPRSDSPGKGYYHLIDGWHRLAKAHLEGRAQLPAYLLTREETLAIELTGRMTVKRRKRNVRKRVVS